jgi:hypothetical protein
MPRVVLVCRPDQFEVERSQPDWAFGAWFVELAEPDCHVAADDDPAIRSGSPSTGTGCKPGASTHSRMV